MPTPLTVQEFQSFIQKSAFGSMQDMSPDDFISYLNQAILNTYEKLTYYAPKVYSAKATISVNGFTADLPDDYNQEQEAELYYDENVEVSGTMLPDELFSVIAGELRFTNKQSGKTYYLRYTKEPNEYATSSEVVEETVSVRTKNVLLNEVKALYFDAVNEEAPTDAAENVAAKSARSQ